MSVSLVMSQGEKKQREKALYQGQHNGTAGKVAASGLQGPRFDPELGLLPAWRIMFSLCPCGFPLGPLITTHLNW